MASHVCMYIYIYFLFYSCSFKLSLSISLRHLLNIIDPEEKKKQEEANRVDQNGSPRGSKQSPLKRKGSRDLGLIKDRLAEFFNPTKLRIAGFHGSSGDGGKDHRSAELEWMGSFQSKGKGEISESCRQAFAVICQLLLECTTFPVYFTEEESKDLHTTMFNKTGTLKKCSPPLCFIQSGIARVAYMSICLYKLSFIFLSLVWFVWNESGVTD